MTTIPNPASRWLGVLALVWLACAPAHGQELSAEEVTTRVSAARERLALSDQQVADLKPLMEARAARFREIRARDAGDDSRATKLRKLREARAAQEEFEAGVEPILTDAQETEWRTMQKEMRAELKARWRASP